MNVTRLLRILLVALLAGPQVVELVRPAVVSCEETRDCCFPDGTCDASCVVCPCCANPVPNAPESFSAEAVDAPAGPVGTNSGTAALPLLPTDILHVPKSL